MIQELDQLKLQRFYQEMFDHSGQMSGFTAPNVRVAQAREELETLMDIYEHGGSGPDIYTHIPR